ncbi:MAG: tRNA (adenosine(37)-N6)-threonylcarbamoyltransferase complex dimerization subunit type 1 TsaB [Leeuwenhoekiella sp.]
MALILCLETTTTNCSVAIAKDGEVLILKEDMGLNYSHAERLHKYIAEVLKEASIDKKELNAIAVSEGPGSYTGLRIGVSSAKGLCFALDIPLIAIDTLQAMATQVSQPSDSIIPLLDARRMEVYCAVFDSQYQKLTETKAKIVDAESFKEYLEKGITVFIGNGVEKFSEIINNPKAVFIPEALPSSKEMASLAEAKYKISDFEDVAYFEPFYLKDFLITKPKKK